MKSYDANNTCLSHDHDHPHEDEHSESHHEHHHGEPHEGYRHYSLPFFLLLAFAFVEAWGGWWTHSLALLSDAGHMFSDVAALGLAWYGAILAKKTNALRHVSGVAYAELAASIINAVLMLAVLAYIIVEAIIRMKAPPLVRGGPVMAIAFIGLCINIIVAKQLQHQAYHHGESLNNRAAYLHVLGDLLGSVAAILAGATIYFTSWAIIDPILSLLVSILLLVFTAKLILDIWQTISSKTLLVKKHNHH